MDGIDESEKTQRAEVLAKHRPHAPLTLWDRVQNGLHNNPIVVVILLLVIVVGGLKTIFEGYQVVQEVIEEHNLKKRIETSLLPCTTNIKSRQDVASEKMELTFVNSSSNRLIVSWIDENGVPKPPEELRPGGDRLDLDSYAGHVFMLSDPNRGCLDLVVTGTAPYIVERTDDGVRPRLVSPNH